MYHRSVYCLLIIFTLAGNTFATQADQNMNLEQSVCGLKEPILFWLWSTLAGWPDKGRLAGLQNVEDIAFATKDGRTLRGYRLGAAVHAGHDQAPTAKGYLLILQGNAMLADQIIGEFKPYADAGYDVYIYDYRGYGRSEGKRRLKAMVSDYQEIITQLNSTSNQGRFVYAMSFGGIVMLDALKSPLELDRIVIDSTPSRLSNRGCPKDYDPLNHLPADCADFMFIVGLRDSVIPPAMSREMVEKAQHCGATVVRDAEFAHPFMDYSSSVHHRRMEMVEQFLLQR